MSPLVKYLLVAFGGGVATSAAEYYLKYNLFDSIFTLFGYGKRVQTAAEKLLTSAEAVIKKLEAKL